MIGSDGFSGKARSVSARRLRYWLMKVLSWPLAPYCRTCGSTHYPTLEIDHVGGITWKRGRYSAYSRVRKYWQEWRADVRLQVLCGECNLKKGRPA